MMEGEFAGMRRRGGITFGWQSQREAGENRKRNCRDGLMKSYGASCCSCFWGADSTCVCAATERTMKKLFRDRTEAGRLLAGKLGKYANRAGVSILALPRGGVPVGFEVAKSLDAPLDIFVVRKLGLPGDEELAMGAIASGNVRVLNDEVVRSFGVSNSVVDAVAEKEEIELRRRERLYRGDTPGPDVAGKTILLVDDGIATGSTMRAAVAALRRQGPSRIVVAVPAPPGTCKELQAEADEVVSVITPENFYAVGQWYEIFDQTTDREVRELYERSKHRRLK
jgi:putative phosphoribosyl transferase